MSPPRHPGPLLRCTSFSTRSKSGRALIFAHFLALNCGTGCATGRAKEPKYYITFLINGSSEGFAFDTTEEAQKLGDTVGEILTAENPKEMSLDFSRDLSETIARMAWRQVAHLTFRRSPSEYRRNFLGTSAPFWAL
jgi:hypothetical protein